MLHTFSIVTFPPQNWYILFQRGQITQQIFENCMAKLSFFYIIKYPLEYGCCTLFYFCHTKPKTTSHAKKQFPTQNYCTLSSPTEPPSLPTTLLCPG